MDEYLRRARVALAAFEHALNDLGAAGRRPPADRLPAEAMDKLGAIVIRARQAIARLRHSLDQIETTGLDIVDLQVRLEGEGAGLASALKALGEHVAGAPALQTALAPELQTLEERAERVAASLFPNAIEGLREINRLLWNFRPLWVEYGRTLAREVARTKQGRLTPDDLALVEHTAEHVKKQFDAVNTLLNDLAMLGTGDGPSVRTLIRGARTALMSAVTETRTRAAEKYKPFHAVLNRAASLARDIDERFSKLRVPVFPPSDRLDVLAPLLTPAVYAELAGVERFALLNITARLRSIPCGGGPDDHLLADRFAIRVFDVFPDRIYFTADAAFIETVLRLAQSRVFERAPASLHRFNQGSFKQRQFRTGNLQLSYAQGTGEHPDDASRVRVDADIDLYRSSVRHLFGEVLVNHLTGSKTDQFKVWDTLASTRAMPLGGFEVVTV